MAEPPGRHLAADERLSATADRRYGSNVSASKQKQASDVAMKAAMETEEGHKGAYVRQQARFADSNRQFYRSGFTKRPGDRGFNAQVTRIMRERGFFYGDRLRTTCTGNVPFAHTMSAAWLAGPETPIDRLLVVHRTGSGKTNVMVHILDNYFNDPRPKIAIFPRNELVRNFYEKMFDWPNQYTLFASARAKAQGAKYTMQFFKETSGMESQLHLRGRPAELAAPLRCIRYTVAGGSEVFPRGGAGLARMPVFKYPVPSANPYDNKIILMDEVHSLIDPPKGTPGNVKNALARLRQALYTCTNSVVVGLTATPFVNSVKDGEELLKVIKGREFASSPTNEGFVSYFDALPPTIYPRIKPEKAAFEILFVRLQGANEKKYLEKAKGFGKKGLPKTSHGQEARLFALMNYCNMAGFFTQANRADFRKRLQKEPRGTATKLDFIARETMAQNEKTAILIHKRLGFAALEQIFRIRGNPEKDRIAFLRTPKTAKERLHNPILAAFNAPDNMHGQKIRVLVLDADSFGEGIDLIGVRHFYIAHPAPSYALYKQWSGRVLRACAYAPLAPSQRNVTMRIFVARLGGIGAPKTADEIILARLEAETKGMEDAMEHVFRDVASDRIVLGSN